MSQIAKLFLLFFSLLTCHNQVIGQNNLSFAEVPVLLLVSTDNQPDTMGFSVATQLPELIYSLILQDKISLWDSPKKNIRIQADALQAIENATQTSFLESKNIFINEVWTANNKKFSFKIFGFSFMNIGPKGKVSYGYVELIELENYLKSEKIKSNVNGFANVSVWDAIMSRRYLFSVVQFDRTNFESNPSLAETYRNVAISPQLRHVSQIKLNPSKEIVYAIEKKPAFKEGIGYQLFEGLEQILYENLDIFFEIGADKYFDFKTYRSEFAITRIEVEEIWEKHNEKIGMSALSLVLYVNNKKLKPIPVQELRRLQFSIALKSIEDILIEKQFSYQIVRVNKSMIANEDAPLFLRGLLEHEWSQLSRYVKYSKTN